MPGVDLLRRIDGKMDIPALPNGYELQLKVPRAQAQVFLDPACSCIVW